jgi:hypothetical protein
MKTKILQFLFDNGIPFDLGQVVGGYESITLPYKERTEFIEWLRTNRVKVRNILYTYSEYGMTPTITHVTIIFEKESRF